MQAPKLIVLGLISQGFNYGFAMEQFIERSKMRLWAQIGKSTIYKSLRNLLKSGAVTEKTMPAERGPGKKIFQLTAAGKRELTTCVDEALASTESVYSDRIVGLVFASSLSPDIAAPMLERTIAGLENAQGLLREERTTQGGDPMAGIVLDFYSRVYQAEQQAARATLALLNQPQTAEPFPADKKQAP